MAELAGMEDSAESKTEDLSGQLFESSTSVDGAKQIRLERCRVSRQSARRRRCADGAA